MTNSCGVFMHEMQTLHVFLPTPSFSRFKNDVVVHGCMSCHNRTGSLVNLPIISLNHAQKILNTP